MASTNGRLKSTRQPVVFELLLDIADLLLAQDGVGQARTGRAGRRTRARLADPDLFGRRIVEVTLQTARRTAARSWDGSMPRRRSPGLQTRWLVKRVKELTTTSYAVLGLLALKPWTAYELSLQMQRSITFMWPRAERAIYDEPKTLVAHGLAKATSQPAGNRPRTVYRITAKGRRGLAAWLEQPSSPPAFESEAMVRATYAEYGDKDALLRTIRSLREHAQHVHTGAEDVATSYLEGRAPFPERAHIVALNGRFILDYIAMVRRWTDWATDVVQDWPGTDSPAVWPEALTEFQQALASSKRHAPDRP